ncbi:hypothetical protein L2E82_17456 [Cichorium intybus]|uniref:Uncharacterized protein n=1 Tax=Cichorium intybus TaxID=13427 RepID=A0ACB9F8T7_CICIN|nr:hypothetical protein L2E82_17456 [Cichorium intybus]
MLPELKVKGVNTIACISVNDAFVLKAWKADLKIRDEVLILSDGNGDFTKAIGCELDLNDNAIGLGVRYAMLVEDGVVKVLNIEEGGAFTSSSAQDMLARSRRYAMLVEDGVVKVLNIEEGGAFTSSSAQDMLAAL